MPFFRNSNALRILLLTSHDLSVYDWSRKQLSPSRVFGIHEQGVAEFGRYLDDSPDIPLYLVADLAEEDFRNETVPHALGRDRRLLYQRKLSQLFRTAEYRSALFQGRESQGRRDDKVLFSALTNNERLSPWINCIIKNRIPLKGISSSAILKAFLASHMQLEQVPHLLLVTTHQPNRLRLTYFQNCRLNFSRLLTLSDHSAGNSVEVVMTETRHTRQYLERLKLIPHDQPMAVHLFTSAEEYADWNKNSYESGNLLHFHCHETEAIAGDSDIEIPDGAIGATAISIVHALRTKGLPNPYGSKTVVRYHDIAQIRKIMNYSSMLIISIGFVSGIHPLITGIKDLAHTQRLNNESTWLDQQYQTLRQNFPSTPILAEDMKNVVETVEAIQSQSFSPMDMMAQISLSLACCQEIQLKTFDWQESTPDVKTASTSRTFPGIGARDQKAATRLMQAILDRKLAVTAELRGVIDPFTGYRNAHDSISRFISALEKTRGLQASALTMPMETGAQTATKASLDGLPIQADFSLKIDYRPTP